MEGIPRNFEIFEPLDFLADVTQHIPDKGERQIRYYGYYSNKKRGMRQKLKKKKQEKKVRKCKMSWAALIKCVYEVDSLLCPKCGSEMKMVFFIEKH